MSDSLPALDEVATAVHQAGLGVDPGELHGSLCGWLAGGAPLAPDWPAQVMADPALAPAADDSVLGRLGTTTARQLEDREFGLQLLMPPADAPLAVRSGALFAWCRGFLGGFGPAARAVPPLSDEGREALAALARLAAASPQYDGDEEAEAALAEIEEFVRVAALLLHGDCALGPRHRKQLH